MKASICIVNLNARKHLGPCLSSLKDTLGDIPFETIVVDNHSWDGSNRYIQSNFPETKLIENNRNEKMIGHEPGYGLCKWRVCNIIES